MLRSLVEEAMALLRLDDSRAEGQAGSSPEEGGPGDEGGRKSRKEKRGRRRPLRASSPRGSGCGKRARQGQQNAARLASTFGDVAEWEVVSRIGTGTFSQVDLRRHTDSSFFAAVKKIPCRLVIKTRQLQHLAQERAIASSISHPFVVEMYGSWMQDGFVYLVMQYCNGGEFYAHIRKARRMPEDAAKFYTAQIVAVLEYLHSEGIAYRDLKPENIILDNDGYLKLCDFGFAKRLGTGPEQVQTFTLCGTPEYLAPETITRTGHSFAVDWWAVGVLLYEMLFGHSPFESEDKMAMYNAIIQARVRFPQHSELSFEARDFVLQTLVADPAQRLGGGGGGVREHGFFADIDFEALLRRELEAPILLPEMDVDDHTMFDGSEGVMDRSPCDAYVGVPLTAEEVILFEGF